MKTLLLTIVLGLNVTAFAAQAGGQNSNVPSQAGVLRLNSPKANEKLNQTFVQVTYQLVNRGTDPASSPNFTVQLDGNDPITTTAYDYTFTGLAPGAHTVTVTLVDANGVPIANSSVSTKFIVANTVPRPASSLEQQQPVQLASADLSFSDGAPLPLLSVLGFAVLVGGLCTAARVNGR